MTQISNNDIRKFCFDNKIIHVSFDFWNTLAFSNSTFKIERSLLLSNKKSTTIDIVNDALKSIGTNYNYRIESGGLISQSNELFSEVCETIGIRGKKEITELFETTLELFVKHPPTFSKYLFTVVIPDLKKTGISISITSNTAFIPGKTIRKVLRNAEKLDFFDFLLFSDEENCAKPEKKMFDNLLAKKQNSVEKKVHKCDILHVGDSVIADYNGCINNGFKGILV